MFLLFIVLFSATWGLGFLLLFSLFPSTHFAKCSSKDAKLTHQKPLRKEQNTSPIKEQPKALDNGIVQPKETKQAIEEKNKLQDICEADHKANSRCCAEAASENIDQSSESLEEICDTLEDASDQLEQESTSRTSSREADPQHHPTIKKTSPLVEAARENIESSLEELEEFEESVQDAQDQIERTHEELEATHTNDRVDRDLAKHLTKAEIKRMPTQFEQFQMRRKDRETCQGRLEEIAEDLDDGIHDAEDAKTRVEWAQENLQGTDPEEIEMIQEEIDTARESIENAKPTVNEARDKIEDVTSFIHRQQRQEGEIDPTRSEAGEGEKI